MTPSSEPSLKKLLPHSSEAERAVLGAVLLDNNSLYRLIEYVKVEDFHHQAHRLIFDSMITLHMRNENIDTLTLAEELKRQNQLEDIGGVAYISFLMEGLPTPSNLDHYLKIVKEKSLLRELINLSSELSLKSYEESSGPEELLDTAEESILRLSQERESLRRGVEHIGVVVGSGIEKVEQLMERRQHVTGVPSGYKDLDQETSGFQAGELIIIAGRPSSGKTAFALNIVQNVALNNDPKIATLVFSLEMTRESLFQRLLAAETRVNLHYLRSGMLPKRDAGRLRTTAGKLKEESEIYIDDTASITPLEMKAKARRAQATYGIKLIIVDYLQLMRSHLRVENRTQEITQITHALKDLAKDLKIPVIALSQLSRAIEARTDHRPQLSDLRESGSIEQDADLVAFIHRPELYAKEKNKLELKGQAEIIIAKQRNGPIGKIPLVFISQFARFENFAASAYPPSEIESRISPEADEDVAFRPEELG